MQFTLEESVLDILNQKMHRIFYLNDLVQETEKVYRGDLGHESLEVLIERLLSDYALEAKPIVQRLGYQRHQGVVFRKLYEENSEGEFIQSFPHLPDLFELKHIEEVRLALQSQLGDINSKLGAYARLIEKSKEAISLDIEVVDELLAEVTVELTGLTELT